MSFQISLSAESVSSAYPDEPIFVAPESTIAEVLQLLRAQHSGSVLICKDKDDDAADASEMVGIFTERDALRCMAQEVNLDQPISAVMSSDPAWLGADTTVGDAIKTMSDGGYRHLPIVSHQGTPTGMCTVYGIIHYLVDHFPQTIYTLPPKPGIATSEREGA